MLFETMDSDHNTLKVGVQLNPEEVQILENIKANKKVVESLPNMNINWRIVNNTWDDVATEYPSKGCQLSSNEEDELNKAYHELQHKPLTSFLRRCSSSSIDGDKISNKKDELSKTHHELQHKPAISFLGKSSSSSIDGDEISEKEDELSKSYHELQHKPVISFLRKNSYKISKRKDELNKTHHELRHKPVISFLGKSSSSIIKRDKISKKKDELSKTHHELKSKPVTSFLGKSSSLGTDKRDEIQSSSVTVNQSLLYLMNTNALNTSKLQTFYRNADTKVTHKGIRQPLVTATCRARVNANIKTNTAA